jgi:hypothetical protein
MWISLTTGPSSRLNGHVRANASVSCTTTPTIFTSLNAQRDLLFSNEPRKLCQAKGEEGVDCGAHSLTHLHDHIYKLPHTHPRSSSMGQRPNKDRSTADARADLLYRASRIDLGERNARIFQKRHLGSADYYGPYAGQPHAYDMHLRVLFN